MKKTLKIGDKSCIFYKDLTHEEHDNVLQCVKDWTKDAKFVQKTESNLQTKNSGTTIVARKHILVLISDATSKAEFLNTLAHEIRHVVDTLLFDLPDVDPAQLTGDIFMHFADWV